jgi:hypothetical protein
MMNLQMGFVCVSGYANSLGAQLLSGARSRYAAQAYEQISEAVIKRAQVSRSDSARATALDIDRRNVADMCRTKRAPGQKRSSPTPKDVEAGGHGTLRPTHFVIAGHIANPRKQFVGTPSAVQINVVSALREQLRVEQMGQPTRHWASGGTWKHACQITSIDRITARSGVKSSLVQHGHYYNRSMQIRWAPMRGPMTQERWALVFVTVSGAVQQQHWTWAAVPDIGIKSYIPRLKPTVMEAAR